MIIHLEDVQPEDQPGRPLVLRHVITAEGHTPDLSVTWVEIHGHHERVVNEACDRAYYIIEGNGRFQVGDRAPVGTVGAGDFVFIPRGTPYEFEGEMRYVVMNGPAFRAGGDKVLPSAF